MIHTHLNMLNNEQKYNKALEQAKKELSTRGSMDCDAARLIFRLFPQLQESEDERIRRELIETIRCISSDCQYAIFLSEQQKQRYLAWLEKQKVNTEGDFGRGYDCGYQAGYAVAMNEMKPKVATPTLDSEKQKEPQNKSMAHEDCSGSGTFDSPLCKDKNLDDIAQEYVKGVREYNPTPDWNLIQSAVCYGYHLAEQKEQKPAEWSKEDEMYLSQAIETLEHENYLILAEKLKSLKPQPKQEWSEEDKEMIDDIIRALPKMAAAEDNILPAILPSVARKYAERLKSLKPQYHGDVTMTEAYKMGKEAGIAEMAKSMPMPEDTVLFNKGVAEGRRLEREDIWKPSEEQIKHLLILADYFEDMGGKNNAKDLRKLGEQLKKLKEE